MGRYYDGSAFVPGLFLLSVSLSVNVITNKQTTNKIVELWNCLTASNPDFRMSINAPTTTRNDLLWSRDNDPGHKRNDLLKTFGKRSKTGLKAKPSRNRKGKPLKF